MKKIETNLTEALLSSFTPLDTLSSIQLKALISKCRILDLADDEMLFEQGDKDNQGIFIISGSATILAPNGSTITITAGDELSRSALAHHQPRQVTVKAKNSLKVLSVNAEMLDLFLSWNQQASCDTTKIQDQDYWISCLLSSPVFSKIPIENILILTRDLREIEVKKDQVIISQGELHDYYYIIKKGRCQVSRKIGENKENQIIAELNVGQGFGEESLITDKRRNASITMMEDGLLICMSKKELFEYVLNPVLSHISFENYKKHRKNMTLIDVRSPDEFKYGALSGSINVPLPVLRLKASGLHKNRLYIVCSSDGKRSAVAAYLLIQQGLRVSTLKEKLQSLPLKPSTKQPEPPHSAIQIKPTSPEARTSTPPISQEQKESNKSQPSKKIVWEIASDYWGCPIASESEEPATSIPHKAPAPPINTNHAVFEVSDPVKTHSKLAQPNTISHKKSISNNKYSWVIYMLLFFAISSTTYFYFF
ncbi:MAG: cyclic nucleotide-binding domain-containing protein [Gammaproteobacteria bacterium]|nr:cyclic nucleotide-binding domain-containing protein [Gammaproteobacteria bacterium]